MKRFLMCEPKYFDVCYVINPWMAGNLGKVDKALTRRQRNNQTSFGASSGINQRSHRFFANVLGRTYSWVEAGFPFTYPDADALIREAV